MGRIKSNQILALVFGISILIGGCKYEQYASGDFPDQYITFGTYGGLTGDEDKKVLLPNGMLFGHHIGDEKYTLLAEISRSEAKKLINEVIDAGIKTKKLNQHSDLSFFLSYFENGQEYLWVWGNTITGIPKEVESIYPKLNVLIPVEGDSN